MATMNRLGMLLRLVIVLSLILGVTGCGEEEATPTPTLEGLTAEEASEVLEIALSSESFASYRARFKETWVGEGYFVQRLTWVSYGVGEGQTEMLPGVQIYFGEDIERRGGMEVLLLVDLDAGEVVHSFDKPLKPLPTRP